MNEDDSKFEKTHRSLAHPHELHTKKILQKAPGGGKEGGMNGSVTPLWWSIFLF